MNAIHFRTEHCKGEKLGTTNNEMVADESIKEKESILRYNYRSCFKERIYNRWIYERPMFSHTPVVYVNEDVWGAITQPNQKIIAQLHLTQIKRLKCSRYR